jgi:hypothetical protein
MVRVYAQVQTTSSAGWTADVAAQFFFLFFFIALKPRVE